MDSNKIIGKATLMAVILTLLLVPRTPANAQFGGYGVKASLGLATISDDLTTRSPIFSAGLGGYINYTFAESHSIMAETFFLQTGLNLIRRGSNFQVVLDMGNTLSERKGYYHAYYIQLPVLACFHMELPIRKAGHLVGVFAGPAVSYGLFGRCRDRMVSPGLSSRDANYDEKPAVFSRLKRLDVSAIVGISYEYGPYTVSFVVDHGFLATSTETDVLRVLDRTISNDESLRVEIPNGHNAAYMLSFSYQLGKF